MADSKISALTTDATPNRTNDFAPTYDASATATKKVALKDFGPIVLVAQFAAFSPADNTTYYWGAFASTAPTTSANARRIFVQRSGIITAVYVSMAQSVGSAETSTIYLRYGATTDTTITDTWVNNAGFVEAAATGLSIAVAAGNFFELKWTTPTWATNPTGVVGYAQIFME